MKPWTGGLWPRLGACHALYSANVAVPCSKPSAARGGLHLAPFLHVLAPRTGSLLGLTLAAAPTALPAPPGVKTGPSRVMPPAPASMSVVGALVPWAAFPLLSGRRRPHCNALPPARPSVEPPTTGGMHTAQPLMARWGPPSLSQLNLPALASRVARATLSSLTRTVPPHRWCLTSAGCSRPMLHLPAPLCVALPAPPGVKTGHLRMLSLLGWPDGRTGPAGRFAVSALVGVCVGEADLPGPDVAAPALHPPPPAEERPPVRRRLAASEEDGVRVFCPVESCCMHDPRRCRGWQSHQTMRHHLDDHCSGLLSGHVPAEYLHQHQLEACTVCGLLVKRFHNGVHPRCRPASRAQAARPGRVGAATPDSELPSFADILAAECHTLRHVPHAARPCWAQCLARAVATAVARNSVAAWQELLMLPKAVLVAPHRGGARHRAQAAQATRRRCLRWLEGERASLWQELHVAPRHRAGATLTAEARHSRCHRLAADGDLSRACAALVDPPPLPPTPSVLDELKAKHPQAAAPDTAALSPCRPGWFSEFDSNAVAQAIRGFKRGSSPGPSGLRADHLREALLTAHSDEVALHLAALCHLLARGEAPASLAPHLAGGTLHALPKPWASCYASLSGRRRGTTCGPCSLESGCPPAPRPPSMPLGTGCTATPAMRIKSFSNWIFATHLILSTARQCSVRLARICQRSLAGLTGVTGRLLVSSLPTMSWSPAVGSSKETLLAPCFSRYLAAGSRRRCFHRSPRPVFWVFG